MLLERRRPDCLPEVIAVEGPRLLTLDFGPSLRDVHDGGGSEPSWPEVLARYAESQLDFAADVDDALAAGTPDKRPSRLPALYEELAGDGPLAPFVRDAVEGLGDAVPPTVAHEEAHDGNVFVRDGQAGFLDWAEASVSHPFAGPHLALRSAAERAGHQPGSPEVERLRDAYLEPFTRYAPMAELREAFACGYALAALLRAATWDRIVSPLPPSARGEYERFVTVWLEILAELAAGERLLGG